MKTAREILEELLNTGIKGTFKPNEISKKKIDQALKELRELVPKPIKREWAIRDKIVQYAKGYNNAIRKMLERLE